MTATEPAAMLISPHVAAQSNPPVVFLVSDTSTTQLTSQSEEIAPMSNTAEAADSPVIDPILSSSAGTESMLVEELAASDAPAEVTVGAGPPIHSLVQASSAQDGCNLESMTISGEKRPRGGRVTAKCVDWTTFQILIYIFKSFRSLCKLDWLASVKHIDETCLDEEFAKHDAEFNKFWNGVIKKDAAREQVCIISLHCLLSRLTDYCNRFGKRRRR